jgi:hypothetical protein
MFTGQTVLAQILEFFPRYEFDKFVERYNGNYRTRRFSCRDQFICLAYAQLTFRESLRDIEICLRAYRQKLYHSGMQGSIARNTLAKANEKRDYRIWEDLAHFLIDRARKLYINEDSGVGLNQTAYAFDSTTIDLCLSLFRWAPFRRHKAGIKMHTLIDLRGNIPCLVVVTSGKVHDVSVLDQIPIEPGSFYVMDKAYIDFRRLYRLDQQKGYFVTRGKRNLDFKRLKSYPVDRSTGLRSDKKIRLMGPLTSKRYPVPLRRICYLDSETGKRFTFLTNNFSLSALEIALTYKQRWHIETFFKWIKSHLRIKAFYGNSANAVKTQIWVAICVYVLVAILKKELKLERSLYEILTVIGQASFEKRPIHQLLELHPCQSQNTDSGIQMNLFNF